MAPVSTFPTFIPFVGAVFFFFQIASVKADGKLFALGPSNDSQNLDLVMAQKSCATEGARLASAEELRRAIRDCSFVVCTRGWLADGSIGTTICNRTGSRLQSVKVIDVQLEMDPPPSGRYDAFCVKAEGKPCGDPPSFPHSVLHGHTGFEMGDELHYVCAQGYVMSNKDAAFTLLCHTCGEWFGQVQACVKDETEGHIDYEDNFPDDRSMLNEEHNVKETEEKENEPKKATNDDKKIPFADGNNHIGVKMMYDEQGTKMLYESEDFPIGPTIVNKDSKAAKSTDSDAEAWLDGYPVTQEAIEEEEEEEGDKMDGSMGMEDDISDQSIYVGVSKTGGSTLEKAFLQTGAAPSLTQEKDGIKPILRPQPTSGPENVSVSKGSDDAISYAPTASLRLATQELVSVTTVPHLNLAALETFAAPHLIDHIQLPSEEEMLAFPRQEVSTVPCQNAFADTSAAVVGDALTYGLGGKPFTTFEPCAGLDCSSQDKGPMIATGVTLVCLVLLAAILAVWCFKKQQQKTSVYKLNGKDHTRHQLQQIEMQKV